MEKKEKIYKLSSENKFVIVDIKVNINFAIVLH